MVLEHGCKQAYVEEIVFASAAHHILPDEDTFLVAVIVPAKRLDFDMFTEHIEAHRLDHFYVPFERGVGGRRKHTVRPITLVKQARMEVWFVVETHTLEALGVRNPTEFAHTEVGFDDIVAHFERYVVKLGIFGRPKFVIFELDLSSVTVKATAVNRVCAVHNNDVDWHVCGFDELKVDGVVVDIGDDCHVFEIYVVHTFKPYALPNAGLRGVPNSARFGRLFGVSMIFGVARVGNDEFDDVFTRFYEGRHVKFKRNVTADMLAHGCAVELDFANHIHRVEVNDGVRLHEGRIEHESAMIIKHVVGRYARTLGKPRKQTFR